MRIARLPLVLLTLATFACSETKKDSPPDSASPAPATKSIPLAAGESYLPVPGGKIWYRLTGSGTATPAILLHGGPGFSSHYLKPYEDALKADRRIVRYDQLGGGHSDVISDTTMFNIAHFVAELDSLRSHLGYDKVYLIGHSWGTILAVEYYRVHPEHVAGMVLASSALDIPAWERNTRRMVKNLPDSEQKAIRTREAANQFDSADYQQALGDFYGRYVWRHPDSVNLDSTMKFANMGIYNYMQGPSEFTITGTLKRYDSTPFLRSVKVPVLFTVGEFDEADPATVKRFAAMTPGAKYVVIPGAAHMVGWDNPVATMKAIGGFLRSVDSAKAVSGDSTHAGH